MMCVAFGAGIHVAMYDLGGEMYDLMKRAALNRASDSVATTLITVHPHCRTRNDSNNVVRNVFFVVVVVRRSL